MPAAEMHLRLCLLAMLAGLGACSKPQPFEREAATPAGAELSPSYDPVGIPDFAGRFLAAHNRERDAVGQPSLSWSDALAGEAAIHARELALLGRLDHASRAARRGAGENLWMGTAAAYRIERMVAGWTSEKRYLVAGRFPNVSRTGRWEDVGHYTQIVWPETREVGCAIARHRKWDYLVCRYRPAGNVHGRQLS